MNDAQEVRGRVKADRDPVPGARAPAALHAFSKLVAVFAYLLLIAGGLVTSTGSSLSVPDWPLSFGKTMPLMTGGVVFEHGHRLIAGAVAALTWTLAFWLWKSEPRAWVRKLGYLAAGGIVLQAVLGGMTVLLRLPPAVSISHACLAQAVFCLILAVAQATSPWYQTPVAQPGAGLFKAGVLAIAAVSMQLVFGALLRHTGTGLMLHMGWAGVALLAVLAASTRGVAARRSEYGLYGPSALLSAVVTLQIALGYFAFRVRFSPDFAPGVTRGALVTTTHLAVGALLLGTTVVWTLRARRAR